MVREPAGEGIRVDSGVADGVDVGTGYDPLLAKVVAFGADRATALARLRHALSETVVLGVGTNVSFLRTLAGHDDVVAGRLDTGLVERLAESLVERQPPAVAYAAYALLRLREMWPGARSSTPGTSRAAGGRVGSGRWPSPWPTAQAIRWSSRSPARPSWPRSGRGRGGSGSGWRTGLRAPAAAPRRCAGHHGGDHPTRLVRGRRGDGHHLDLRRR